jgi:hypothetical protein
MKITVAIVVSLVHVAVAAQNARETAAGFQWRYWRGH